jgi:hypothetical protein
MLFRNSLTRSASTRSRPKRASLAKIETLRGEFEEIPELRLRRRSPAQLRFDGFVILACSLGLVWWIWNHWQTEREGSPQGAAPSDVPANVNENQVPH